MTADLQRVELFRRAERIAGQLAARKIGRNLVRGFIDALVHGDGDWETRRRAALALARRAPRSWLRLRSAGMPDQLAAIEQELSPLLDGRLGEAEARFVLGWVGRLLSVRGER